MTGTTPPSSPDGGREPRRLVSRMRAAVRDVEKRAAQSQRRRVRVPYYIWRMGVQLVRQWARDRCPQQAGSLAFQTVLSTVPALALGMAILRATGSLHAESTLVDFLSGRFVPVSQEEISSHLIRWSENVTFESLGLVGLIATVFLAFLMFNSVEKTFNVIWRAERRRPLPQRLIVFYAMATVGPALIGISLYYASDFGLTVGWSGFFLSITSTFAALFFANMFLPATRVRPGPAAFGALLTTVLSEVAKFGFAWYASGYALGRYSGIYGAVAVVPLFMVWIYWSWLMFLLGAEAAYAAQNIHLLESLERRGPVSLESDLLRNVNGPMAARLMLSVCDAYHAGQTHISRSALRDRYALSDDVLDAIVRQLKERDLLVEVDDDGRGFVPGRPPDEIALREVLAAFKSDLGKPEKAAGRSKLDRILAEIDGAADEHTATITLAELSERDHGSGQVT